MNAALDLERPQHLQDPHWTAIETMRQRLVRAVEADDKPQIIGCCKDLAESVAKVTVEERGHTTPGAVKYPAMISQAHIALDRQPGAGLTTDGGLRALAQTLKGTVTQLAEIRNELGTGHGRAVEPHVHAELAEVCVETTMLWVRWALRRLDHMLYGAVTPFVTDLTQTTFIKGVIAARLKAANLPELEEADQRRLGIAVGRRAMRGTYNVHTEGVVACADGDLVTWPEPYRRGVVDGLLVNAFGQLTLTPDSLNLAQRILAALPEPGPALIEAAVLAKSAPPSQDTIEAWNSTLPLQLFRAVGAFGEPATRTAVGDAWTALWNWLRTLLGPGVSTPEITAHSGPQALT